MAQPGSLLPLFKEQLENEGSAIAGRFELTKRGDQLIWWYFMKLLGLEPVDIGETVCDGGNDLGLDAIRIDEENLVHFYSFKNPANLDHAFPEGDVDRLLGGLQLILRQRHGTVANPELKSRIDEIYQIVPSGYRLHLVTSGTGLSNAARHKLGTFVDSLGAPSEAFFSWHLEDLPHLQDAFYQRHLPTLKQPIHFVIDRQPPYQIRAANHDCYLFHASGETLAQLYQNHGEQLLQQNIRVYEGDRATNASIRQTCTGEDSPNFFHYNNGVNFLCEEAQWDQFVGKITLKQAQVVNGGQTIRVLHTARTNGSLHHDVWVPVRVITSHGDKEFSNNVAVNLNNQNRIESSFLRSNHPRIVQLSHSLASLGWYLERREDEIKILTDAERKGIEQRIGGPLEGRIIRIKDGTQAYAATYLRQPELAKKNPKRMFMGVDDGGVFERIFGADLTAEHFAASQRLKWKVDDFIGQFMARKRRKHRVDSWRNDYADLMGTNLVGEHSDVLDQVVPQSSIFLCAILFEDYVRLREIPVENLLDLIDTEVQPLADRIGSIISFAKAHPQAANRSWPTLLKSQSFFENYVSYLRGRSDFARVEPDPAAL